MLRPLTLVAVAAVGVAAYPLPVVAEQVDAPAAIQPETEPRLSAAARATDADGDGVTEALARQIGLSTAGAPATIGVIALLGETGTVAAAQEAVPSLRDVRAFEPATAFSARVPVADVERLSQVPGVELVEWDAPVHAANDLATRFGGVDAVVDGRGYTGDRDGSETTYSRNDTVAAVLDTGIDVSHPDLDGGKVIAFVDCVGGSCTPTPAFDDDPTGHGTHVAATLAGTGDGTAAYRGVAPGAALVGIKVLNGAGDGIVGDLRRGIDWAVANRGAYGIKVLNLSVQGADCQANAALTDAIETAFRRGLLVVVAAGNRGPNPCSVTYPGDVAEALTVGSVRDPGEGGWSMELTSGRGPTASGRTKPDVVAPGVAIRSAKPGGGYHNKSGTSMATPYVAGLALLLIDARPDATAAQLFGAIVDTASNFGGLATPNDTYGTGRVDAEAAVAAMAVAFAFGKVDDVVIIGDWDGDGISTPGIQRGNLFYLRNRNSGGKANIVFAYGRTGDVPVVGDWDGDGVDTIGVRRGNVFYLRNKNTTGDADIVLGYGKATDTPVVGDWDGNGTDTFGVRRDNRFYLRNTNTTGVANIVLAYGKPDDTAVVGDWDGNGTDTFGVHRDGRFLLRNSNTSGPARVVVAFGEADDVPIIGDWNGDRTDDLGVRDGRTHRLLL